MNSMNGRDMIMPMASITLPIYRNKYKAAQKESKLLQQAAEEKYADALNRLQAELYRSKYQLDDAVRKIDLYRKQSALIDATRNLMIREFASGKSALADILRIQRQLSDYRLKESEAVAAYNTAAATVRKLISNRSE
jgi:outer membrane protein TolC